MCECMIREISTKGHPKVKWFQIALLHVPEFNLFYHPKMIKIFRKYQI